MWSRWSVSEESHGRRARLELSIRPQSLETRLRHTLAKIQNETSIECCALGAGTHSAKLQYSHARPRPSAERERERESADSRFPRRSPAPGSAPRSAPRPPPASAERRAAGKKPVALVYFVGGVTYAEIAAMRFLNTQQDFPYTIVVATTNIINGSTFIKSLVYEIENRLERRSPAEPYTRA